MHRTPPEKPNARRTPGAGKETAIKNWKPSYATQPAKFQAPVILTAIPADHDRWAMKAISADGSLKLPGIFTSRLEALGACVMLATQCDGEVRP